MDIVQLGSLLLRVDRRVKFISAHGETSWKKRSLALEMILEDEAVIIQAAPLVIREARFLEFQDEARRRRGRLIPGVEHPDPDRLLSILGKDGTRHPDHAPQVFSHHEEEGSCQGVCFPPQPIFEEVDFQRYKRRFLRRESEEEYQRQLVREGNVARNNRVQTSAHPGRAGW